MSKNRYAARTDENESEIVKDLRKLGYTVITGVDDIFVSGRGINFWFEIKDKRTLDKNGKVRESEIKDSQKKIRETWRGQYDIVSSTEQILSIMKETFKRLGI